MVNALRFVSILFTALALGGGLAHVLQLGNKMKLPGGDYLIVQQLYKGWALLGIAVVISLISTLLLTIMVWKQEKGVALVLPALICIIGTQLIFWIFTYPVNQQTRNWTELPNNWTVLRNRWEFSHAASASLNFIALILLLLSVLRNK